MCINKRTIYKISVLILSLLLLTGCKAIQSKMGKERIDYSKACELKPIKLPPNALAVSKRYDIPKISNYNDTIITNPVPPDYCKE